MPRPITLTLANLLACGPIVPPADLTSTTDETTTTTGPPTSTALPDPPPTTTTTTNTATTTTPDSTTTLIPDFVIEPDGGAGGFIKCDVFKQDCPRGQKCTAWAQDGASAWNATKCVDVTGDAGPGEPCTVVDSGVSGIDDCAFGAMCWDVDATYHGFCIALCTGSWEAPTCPQKSYCVLNEPLNLCIPTCDPLLQDCFGDDLCIPNPDGTDFTCVLDASGDLGQTNDPCEFANACDKGLMCLDTATASSTCNLGTAGCCQPFCKFPGSPCPNPDQQCVQFFDPMNIPPGYESVGVCAIPA